MLNHDDGVLLAVIPVHRANDHKSLSQFPLSWSVNSPQLKL